MQEIIFLLTIVVGTAVVLNAWAKSRDKIVRAWTEDMNPFPGKNNVYEIPTTYVVERKRTIFYYRKDDRKPYGWYHFINNDPVEDWQEANDLDKLKAYLDKYGNYYPTAHLKKA